MGRTGDLKRGWTGGVYWVCIPGDVTEGVRGDVTLRCDRAYDSGYNTLVRSLEENRTVRLWETDKPRKIGKVKRWLKQVNKTSVKRTGSTCINIVDESFGTFD